MNYKKRVKRRAWTPNEESILRDMSNRGYSNKGIAKFLRRTTKSIISRKSKLNILKASVRKNKSEREENNWYHKGEGEQINTQSMNSTETNTVINSISNTQNVTATSRRRWLKEEDNLLEYMVNNGQDVAKIARVLNRTPAAVAFRKSKMGIYLQKSPVKEKKHIIKRLWSEDDEKMLSILYSDENRSIAAISEYMGRTEWAIRRRLSIRGLKRKEISEPQIESSIPIKAGLPIDSNNDSLLESNDSFLDSNKDSNKDSKGKNEPKKKSGIKGKSFEPQINATIKIKNMKMIKRLIKKAKKTKVTLNITVN